MNLERFAHLSVNWCFSASIGSFQGLPAEASEVILLSQRLALKYNTTHRGSCQHFLTSFFQILCGGGQTPSQALPRQLPQRGSQAVKFVAKALGSMRKFSAALLPLPLGEVASRSDDGEGAALYYYII